MPKKLRFAIVGCGRISERHISALQSIADDCQITAVCDSDPSALKYAQVQTSAQFAFSKYEDLLKSPDVDVVSLCTPSGLHAEQTCLAAVAKKHIVTEKPMATHLKDGLRAVDVCEREGVKLFVVKQNRLNPTVQALKQAVEGGRFGRLYMITCNVFWCRPQSYYDQAPWRGTWKLDGGAFMNQASHYVDLLVWLFGPVAKVAGFTGTLARNIEAEDTGAITLQWKNGAIGSMNVTMLTHNKNYEGSITVMGEKGTVRLGGLAANKILTWDFADNAPNEADEVERHSYEISSVYGNSHLPYYKNVISSLKENSSAHVDGREGLKSLALLEAIYETAKTGRPAQPEYL